MAHTFAYLRINTAVTDNAARLTTGLPGSALAGRVLHPLDNSSEFQGGIVTFLSHQTSIVWSHPAADKRQTSSNDVCPPSQARLDGYFGG